MKDVCWLTQVAPFMAGVAGKAQIRRLAAVRSLPPLGTETEVGLAAVTGQEAGALIEARGVGTSRDFCREKHGYRLTQLSNGKLYNI